MSGLAESQQDFVNILQRTQNSLEDSDVLNFDVVPVLDCVNTGRRAERHIFLHVLSCSCTIPPRISNVQ